MSTRVIEQVDDWDEQPFSDGYRGLHDLADRDFSGVVRAGGAELFMTKGTVVGINHGAIEDFEDGSGTCYEAPTPALPLLAVMQDRSDEVRGEYYTEETSISAVDRTLEDGNFTGFVELSENVLSGDYFVVYHQGRSMSVAYVGASGQLLQGDEAFERADDEVGIYQVRPVDIEPIEIPEPEPDGEQESSPDPADGTESASEADAESESEQEPEDETGEKPTGDETAESEVETDDDTTETAPSQAADEASGADGESSDPDNADDGAENQGTEEDSPAASETSRTTGDDAKAETADDAGPTGSETAAEASGEPEIQTESQDSADAVGDRGAERASDTEGARGGSVGVRERDDENDNEPLGMVGAASESDRSVDLETQSIPSLDPERTSTTGDTVREPGTSGDRTDTNGAGRHQQPEQSRKPRDSSRKTEPQPRETATSESESSAPGQKPASDPGVTEATESQKTTERRQADATEGEWLQHLNEKLADAKADLEQVTSERNELRAEREDLIEERDGLAEERDELQTELEAVREERDELRGEIERLEEEIATLDTADEAGTNADRELAGTEALSGTDLFVRYHTKGDATLEKAHDGTVRREDVRDNLRLEKHTQFDAESVSINGRSYDEFIEERVEYQFVTWVIRDLLFEIQNTGNTDALRDLYDALPRVNRIELDGAVSVADDGGEETEELFDVVFRERMGDPLFVADINHSRQGASQGMMERLVTSAERVGQTSDAFAAAFLVTESFFEPEALETVGEATQSGLLSRNKRASFVNLSRKQGYHLCLVEARNENFHLEVPEL